MHIDPPMHFNPLMRFTMRLLILTILIALVAPVRAEAPAGCGAGPCPVARPNVHAAIDSQAIVRIANDTGTSRAFGSGTLIDADGQRGWIVTCEHLFRDGTGQVVVTFPNGRSFAARVARVDELADLAALEIAPPTARPIALADEAPQRGDALTSCGYGSDGRLLCNRGQLLGYVTTLGGHGRETLELSGTARLGDSGGPVLDAQGRLVAVLFGTDGRVVDGTVCGRVRRFLEGLSPRFRRQQRARPIDTPPPLAAPRDTARPQPPKVEVPGEDHTGPGLIERAAEPWLAARVTALLVAFGLPGGIAGVAGGALVWFVMRRGRKRLQGELARLKARRGEPATDTSEPADPSVIERHHNRYVPYEASTLDKAWAAAHARVGERYPGAVPYLKLVEGVKDQLLSGGEPQI